MNLKAPKSAVLVNELVRKRYLERHIHDLKQHNHNTLEHSMRVGALAADIGYEYNLKEQEIKTLAIAGLLHDLGKCDISNNILEKPGPLNSSERKEIDKHALYGRKRIQGNFLEAVRRIVGHHHDYGSQKNRRTKRTKRRRTSLPNYTEIVNAADIFDALASKRSYKRKYSKRKIRETMESEFTGNQTLVEQLLERY
jgi:HD-GYP domain-containing protein (c-di-GMP phosphodiesterase class II)